MGDENREQRIEEALSEGGDAMNTRPISYFLAPALLVLIAVLTAVNWYLRPERVSNVAPVLLLLAIMTVAFFLSLRRTREEVRRRAAEEIRRAIMFAGLIVVIPLSANLAAALGVISDVDLSKRVTMAIVGAFFVFTGNALPKTLTPISALQCDVAKVQAFQRLTGWTWVLMGLAYAIVWLVLPLNLAKPVSMALLLSGMLVVATQIIRLRRRRAAH
jgi:hypothetical protein